METDVGMTNVSFAIAATCLALLALSSLRLRTTVIGRSYLGFVLVAELWALLHLGAVRTLTSESVATAMTTLLALVMGAAILRLAFQAASDTPNLPVSTEAILVVAPVLLWIASEPRIAAPITSARQFQ